MAKRTEVPQYKTENSFAYDQNIVNASGPKFVRREPNYPLTDDRGAVNINWTSEAPQEQRRYRGVVPRPGYDQANPSSRFSIPNWDISINRPTTTVPQTSHVPTISIISPINAAVVSVGDIVTVKANSTEYPYSAEFYVNGTFVATTLVRPSERGESSRLFMFDYTIPTALVGTQVTLRVDVRGAHTAAAGRFVYKPFTTGSTDAKNRMSWNSQQGTTYFFDQNVKGFEPPTAPDYLFVQPSNTSSVTINVS